MWVLGAAVGWVIAVSTHGLTVAGGLVTKRYRSWDRGEPLREWTVLRHLSRWAPDLAPAPVSAELSSRPPSITMTLLPGAPLDPAHWHASFAVPLVTALRRLWAVPLVGVPGRWDSHLGFARRLLSAPRPVGGILARAYDAAVA